LLSAAGTTVPQRPQTNPSSWTAAVLHCAIIRLAGSGIRTL